MSNPLTVLRARRRLAALLRERRYDVAVCHSVWSQVVLGAAVRASGVPNAFFLHDAASGRHWLERLARRTAPDLAICNSQFTLRLLSNLYRGVRAAVVYPPVHAPPPLQPGERERIRAGLGVLEDEVVVIQAARLESWKGQRLHLAALGRLKEVPGWVCWIVGGAQRPFEAAFLEDLRALAREQGIAERVRFLGQRADVRALMAAADVYCQPNLGPEPFGIALVEALHAGLPVVTTAMGGALEVVDDSCGFRVMPREEEVAGALRGLITNAELRRTLGAGGPARARSLADPAEQLAALARALESVCAGAGEPG